jgi:hypothetical protein
MQSTTLVARQLVLSALLSAVLGSATAALAKAGAAGAPAAGSGPTPSPASESGRKWEVAPDGRRFYVERLEKRAGYVKLDNGQVRTPWGIDIEPFEEDESSYYIRVWDHGDVPTLKGPKTTWTEAEIAAIEAEYPPPLERLPASRRIAFEPFDNGLPKAGQRRNGFRLADLDGDGALDLVQGPARKALGTPVIFRGDRRGNWRRWEEASFPPFPYDYGDAAVADFDGDGTLDLALAIHLKGVVVLAHDGKGKFTLASEGIPFQASRDQPDAFSSRTLVATDWDRDGRVDLLAAGDGPRMGRVVGDGGSFGIAWYRNLGAGSWERRDDRAQDFYGESLTLGDFDGDGDDDVAVGSNLFGSSRLLVLSQGESRWKGGDVLSVRPGVNPSIAVADFDGDSELELAVGHQTYEGGSWRFGLDLHRRAGDGSWKRHGIWTLSGQDRLLSIAAGDIDGDGRPDLAAASANGRVVVLRNDGGARFTLENAALGEGRENCGGYRVAIEDLDGDGRGDLAISFAGEESGLLQRELNRDNEVRGCSADGSLRVWRSVAAGQAG